jgi:hypothetical protein
MIPLPDRVKSCANFGERRLAASRIVEASAGAVMGSPRSSFMNVRDRVAKA